MGACDAMTIPADTLIVGTETLSWMVAEAVESANAILVDVSEHNGPMTWTKTREARAVGAYIRAGLMEYGKPRADKQFERNAGEASGVLAVGYYWPIHPYYDANMQADYFTELIRGKHWDMRPANDVEITSVVTVAARTAKVKGFQLRVEGNLNTEMVDYTRQSWWDRNIVADPLWPQRDLWAARYPWGSDYKGVQPSLRGWTSPWYDGYTKFRDWKDWKLFQFTADSNGRGAEFGGSSSSMDVNEFNGDEAAFYAWIGWPQPVTLEARVGKLEAEARAHGWAI